MKYRIVLLLLLFLLSACATRPVTTSSTVPPTATAAAPTPTPVFVQLPCGRGTAITPRLEKDGDLTRIPPAAVEGLPFQSARSVFAGAGMGFIGAGSPDAGIPSLAYFDGKYLYSCTAENDIYPQAVTINGIAHDTDGTLWVASDPQGMWKFRDGAWKLYAVDEGLPSPQSYGTTVDPQGSRLALTLDGVFYYEPQTDRWKRAIGYAGCGTQPHAHDMAFGTNDDWAIALIHQGVCVHHAGQTILLNQTAGNFPSDEGRSVLFSGGMLYIGTDDQGLQQYDPETGHLTNMNETFSRVMDIREDPYGRLWIAGNKGVSWFENGSWHTYAGDEAYQVDIGCVICLPGQAVWIGTVSNGILFGELPPQTRPSPTVAISARLAVVDFMSLRQVH